MRMLTTETEMHEHESDGEKVGAPIRAIAAKQLQGWEARYEQKLQILQY